MCRLYRPGRNATTFIGERNSGALMGFLYEEMRPDSVAIHSEAELWQHIRADRRVLVVAWLPHDTTQSQALEAQVFLPVAHKLRGALRFATASASRLATLPGVQGEPSIVVIYAENATRIEHSPLSHDKEGLHRWVKHRAVPYFGAITLRSYHGYRRAKLPVALLLTATTSGRDAAHPPWNSQAMASVGKTLRGKVLLGHVVASHAGIPEQVLLGLRLPAMVIHNITAKAFHQMPSKMDSLRPSDVLAFSEAFLRGEVPAVGQIPPHEAGKIWKLQGGQEIYDTIRQSITKDTLLMFHAPWSPACRPALQQLGRVAQAVEFIDTAAVAAMKVGDDGLPQEVAKMFGADGFKAGDLPATVLLRPLAAPLQYAGEAKATQLLKFLRSNAEHWFSLDGEEFTFLRRLKSVVSAREAIKAAFRERRELLVEITRLKEELGIYHKKKQGI